MGISILELLDLRNGQRVKGYDLRFREGVGECVLVWRDWSGWRWEALENFEPVGAREVYP